MALILEVRDSRGVPVWHRLGSAPVLLGRAVSNDVIVDDPYVDARHARITVDDAGVVLIEDIGSVNGLQVNGTRAEGRIEARAGLEVRMGRTTLRFRDADEALPAALAESPPRPLVTRRLDTAAGRLAIVAAMLAAIAYTSWLGNTERSSGGSVFVAVLGAAGATFVWSAVWAIATRGVDRRFHLLGHLAVASLAVLVMLLYGILNEWMTFFFPDASTVSVAYSAVFLGVIASVVAGHLSVVNAASRRARWRAGLIVSGALLILIVAGALVDDDEFSDVPAFPGQLKHAPSVLVPTRTLDEFVDVMREAKTEADKAITK